MAHILGSSQRDDKFTPKIQQMTDCACKVIINTRNSSNYKWQSHYWKKNKNKNKTLASGKLPITMQCDSTQCLSTQSLLSPNEPAQAYPPGVRETQHLMSNAAHSPAWATGRKVRWTCFWRDSVRLKDKKAWILVLAFETGQLLSKSKYHLLTWGKPTFLAQSITTGEVLSISSYGQRGYYHPRRKRSFPSYCYWQIPGTGENSLVFLIQQGKHIRTWKQCSLLQ